MGLHKPWCSHGEAIESLWPGMPTEYYDRADEPFPWWFLSRNRKRPWDAPSYTISANWRHVPLHPASPMMCMVESNLADGWKQTWTFTHEYDHLDGHPQRPKLENPRRLTWRECAALQTFPDDFEPVGSPQSKYMQIGNAVPPRLMEVIVRGITEGSCLKADPPSGFGGQSTIPPTSVLSSVAAISSAHPPRDTTPFPHPTPSATLSLSIPTPANTVADGTSAWLKVLPMWRGSPEAGEKSGGEHTIKHRA